MIPGTYVNLLTGVPLSKDYNNTRSFASIPLQTAYFLNRQKAGMEFTDFTYSRKTGEMRVPVNAENIQDINYVMFQNTNYSMKRYYAFVDSIDYISENTSLIRFTIDAWQTYYFDIDWQDCIIEREHVASDTIGEHLIPEGLDIGETTVAKRAYFTGLSDLCVIIASTYNPYTVADVPAKVYSGVYSGVGYFSFNLSNMAAINSFIDWLVANSKTDAIVTMFMYPKALLNNFVDGGLITEPAATPLTYTFDMATGGGERTLAGYIPKNNKMYTFPYSYIYVINNNGGIGIYKEEYFDAGVVSFVATAEIAPNPTVYLMPNGYKMGAENFDESLALTGYPFCAWTYDVYKDYLARNVVSAPLSVAATALSVVGGIAAKNPMAISAGVLGLADTIGSFYEKSLLPNQAKGALSGGGSIAVGSQNFHIFHKCVNQKQAKVIDDFFTVYGYKTLRVATPTIKTRPYWNYLKLQDTNVFGNCPQEQLQIIRESLQRGITFWHDTDVGNYNRINKY